MSLGTIVVAKVDVSSFGRWGLNDGMVSENIVM